MTQAGESLTAELLATGAKLTFDHRDGDVFTASLVPEGRFAAMAANLGPGPLGFVQFQLGGDGKYGSFRLLVQEDGQAQDFVRE